MDDPGFSVRASDRYDLDDLDESIEPQSGKGVFAGLKVGLPVTLKDEGAAYEVRVLDNARAARCRSQGR